MRTFQKYVLLMLLTIPLGAFAQQTVRGVVTEASSGLPLPGVNVIVKGTTTGTTTDFDGNYEIEAENGSILQFSYIGFQTIEKPVTEATLNVALQEDTQQLDEVVVIGYGTVKKEDATGAVDMVTSKDFNQGPVTSAQQLISGKVAGVSVTSGSGAPGEGQNIVIRGLGSLTLSNSPLIVVDGIPLDNGGVGGSRNPLNLINPNDIESMVVLKDASATSIYGSRAANGVIMITTKKGKDGEFKFNYSGSTVVYSPIDDINVLSPSEFRNLVTETGSDDAIARMSNSATDWQDQIYTNAVGFEHSFSALGNAFGVPMRASLGYSDHDGILKSDNFNRTTASLNLTPSLFDDHLKIELNARGMYTENTFANRGAIGSSIAFDPTKPVFDQNAPDKFNNYSGWYVTDSETGDVIQNNLAPTNPVALLKLQDDNAEVRRFIGNAKVDYKLHFFPDLTATVNMGYDISNSNGRTFVSENMPSSQEDWNGSLFRYSNNSRNRLFDAYLTYQKDVNDHSFNFVTGYSYQDFRYDDDNYNSELEEDGNPDFIQIGRSKNVLLSYFGRFNYGFQDKYLLTATLRADASSKLNPDDRWGYFPSVALAWNIQNEDFLMASKVVDELKLRIGYGEVGNVNGLGDYNFLTRYTGSQSTANYQFGSTFYQTYRPEPINENLRWEVGKTFNAGIDFSLFQRRIYGSINAYIKETQDLISNTTIDPFTNFGNIIPANIGDMENKGFEVALNWNAIRNDHFKWTISYNIAVNDNEITNLPDQQFVGGISGGVGNTIQTHIEGEAPFSFLVYEQVYDDAGKPLEGVYVDRNDDGIINDNDRYIYKDPYADIFMGLNTNLTYKDWDLAIITRANFGNYMYDNVASSTSYLARLTENNILTNLHADYLATGFSTITETNLQSDHYVKDASFFKVDNITLGYTLKNALPNASIRLYGSAQNILTVSDYNGIDPEISGGIDNNFYPRPRSFVFGVNLDF
ncbi:iron complex outermembrane recepter protein [Zhouia amylolytica]|uniref:Iron complex outermembrane recepter protein n=1 Tax=Zhouia amylolytica TaxID=376730 RepID=A0A1I6P4L7_9FLAO|nr:TonB-dependent receptor [Zhouia amylolytica]SFS35038.1 iron complex outermembrane recepter protein [Zhouia amylolytica]